MNWLKFLQTKTGQELVLFIAVVLSIMLYIATAPLRCDWHSTIAVADRCR